MCGRYQRRSDKQKITEAFHLGNVDGLALELAPDYNVAPQTMQPVVIWDEEFGTRTLRMMFWKFLPPFVADAKNYKLTTINAQSEKLMESGLWQESFLKRRCLIPADSFIECAPVAIALTWSTRGGLQANVCPPPTPYPLLWHGSADDRLAGAGEDSAAAPAAAGRGLCHRARRATHSPMPRNTH